MLGLLLVLACGPEPQSQETPAVSSSRGASTDPTETLADQLGMDRLQFIHCLRQKFTFAGHSFFIGLVHLLVLQDLPL